MSVMTTLQRTVASFVEEVPLPYATQGGARFEDQAEFHPHKYVLGLARRRPGPRRW